MRFGCGCLLGLLIMVGIVAGIGWMVFQVLQPATVPVGVPTPEDGRRAQEKVYEIVRRRSEGRGRHRDPVVLSEAELNAFLTRHLVHAGDVPLEGLSVRLPARDRVEFAARVPLGSLLGDGSLSKARSLVPSAWLERPVALRLAGRVRVESGSRDRRYLRIDVEDFVLGHQRLPAFSARLFLDPSTVGLLRWRLPSGVEDVTIEPGRAVVRTAS